MRASRLFANLPNLITVARLLMTPLAVSMMLSQRFVEAFAIFLLAGVSDGVDGFIAKRFNLTSELGAYLDPLADKALLNSIYITLAATGQLAAALRDPGRVARPDDPVRSAGLVAARQSRGDPARSSSPRSTRRADRLRRLSAGLARFRLSRTRRCRSADMGRRGLDGGLGRASMSHSGSTT